MRQRDVALQGTFVEATDVVKHARRPKIGFADHLIEHAGLPGLAFAGIDPDEEEGIDLHDPNRPGYVDVQDFPDDREAYEPDEDDLLVAGGEVPKIEKGENITETVIAHPNHVIIRRRIGAVAVILPPHRDSRPNGHYSPLNAFVAAGADIKEGVFERN